MQLYLIGYRGSGKSTVGRVVAERLDLPFSDSDDAIEAESGMSIKDIFAQKGEPWFRDLEAKVIAELSADREVAADQVGRALSRVVALGGGAVLRESTQEILKATGVCVWLSGSAEFLYQRIQADQATQLRRPNLSQVGGYDEVVELLRKRTPIYERLSDITIAVEGKTPDQVSDEIVGYVNSFVPSSKPTAHEGASNVRTD